MFFCTVCNQDKDLDCFYINRKSGKPHSWCKECRAKKFKNFYDNNAPEQRDRRKAYQKKVMAERPDEERRKSNEYWKANPEKKAAKDKRNHEKHRDARLVSMREYRTENNEKVNRDSRAFYFKTRISVIERLGGKCSCGYADFRALNIDHIDPAYKSRVGKKKQEDVYRLSRMSDAELKLKFQVLCCNCNAIKRIENSENGLNRRNIVKDLYRKYANERPSDMVSYVGYPC